MGFHGTGLPWHGGRGCEGGLRLFRLRDSAASALAALASRGITPGLDLKPEARRAIRARVTRELGLDAEQTAPQDAPIAPEAFRKSSASASAAASAAADTVVKVTGVIVLVEFPDARATFTKEQIHDMGNLKGFNVNGNNGSVRDYFLDVSHGKFEYTLAATEYYLAKNERPTTIAPTATRAARN